MPIKRLLTSIINVATHILVLIAVTILVAPITKWYLSLEKIPGSDYFNTGTYLAKLLEDSLFPVTKWLYHWFTGSVLVFDYPNLHLYAMLPLVKIYGIIQAQSFYSVASFFVFVLFTYLLFWQLAKDKIASAILAVAVSFSASLFPSLIVIGSTTFFATQAFFPLALFLLEKWRQGKNEKYFYLAAVTVGLSYYGHATLGLVFVLPISIFIVYLSNRAGRIKKSLQFILLSMLVGAPGVIHYLTPLVAKILPVSGPRGLFMFVDWEGKEVFWKDFFGISPVLIIGAFIVIVASLFLKHLRKEGVISSYTAAFVYLLFFNLLLYLHLNPISAVLKWPRSLWAFPLVLGAIVAFGFKQLAGRPLIKIALYLSLAGLLITFQGTSIQPIKDRLGGGYVFPELLSKNLNTNELKDLEGNLVPSWLNTSSKQVRIYSLDDRLNMWWNAFYDLPQVRGYFPGLTSYLKEFYLNQIDTSIMGNDMQEALGTTGQRAENTAYFYIDWYSIGYVGQTGLFTLSDYLQNNSVIDRQEKINEVTYIKLNQELASPIISPTNSKTVCLLGSDTAYNYLMRAIARFNLNSKKLISIKGPSYIEKLTKNFTASCDSFIVNDLKTLPLPLNTFRNRGWKVLTDAVKTGKSMYIDTGESGSLGAASGNLPEFFPIEKTSQLPVEKWKFTETDNKLLESVDLSLFSTPAWEGYPWKLSISNPESVRSWAKVILEQEGNPFIVSGNFGSGKVIWSGLNLLFHMDYYDNEEEARLFLNVINEIVPSQEGASKAPFNVEWISPEKRIVTSESASGILFRERYDSGWKATEMNAGKLKIHQAGPNYPGFMYIRLPNQKNQSLITFRYSGSRNGWFLYFAAFFSTFILTDEIIFNGNLISKRLQKIFKSLIKKRLGFIAGWWDKEEY